MLALAIALSLSACTLVTGECKRVVTVNTECKDGTVVGAPQGS